MARIQITEVSDMSNQKAIEVLRKHGLTIKLSEKLVEAGYTYTSAKAASQCSSRI